MIYLVLCVLCAIIFNQGLRFGQKRGANIMAVVAVNYCVAALVSALVLFGRGFPLAKVLDGPVLATALINGVFYFTHILLLLAAYRRVGVGIATALARAGIVVPALTSWALWNEPMTPFRWVALGLVPVSMVLMRRPEATQPHLTLRGDAVLILCFAMAGVILTIHKFVGVRFTPPQQDLYKSALFFVAMTSSLIYCLVRGVGCERSDAAVGVVVGISNASVLLLILLGLASIPAVVFFPTLASLEICLNVFASRLLWEERLLKRQWLGLVLAIGIVFLTNVRSP